MGTPPPNPYETDPAKIPKGDLYADIPLYGRYAPHEYDFKPAPEHINSTSDASLKYWEDILSQCTEATHVYKNELEANGRDVFALGSVIIKSGHLNGSPTRDYSYNDANEVAAIALARGPLAELGVKVPDIYFTGKINGRDVFVQQRIPGVALTVAHPYLDENAMSNYKAQARQILKRLRDIKPPEGQKDRVHAAPAPDPVKSRHLGQDEADIIFSDENQNTDLGLMHNDFTGSTIIVDQGRIVGVVDWEMAGFFGWKTAREVHEKIRTPRRENFAQFDGKKQYEGMMRKLFFWSDLYHAE